MVKRGYVREQEEYGHTMCRTGKLFDTLMTTRMVVVVVVVVVHLKYRMSGHTLRHSPCIVTHLR